MEKSLLIQIPVFKVANDKKMIAVKMVDVGNNQSVYFYSSIGKASPALFSKFRITRDTNSAHSAISKHLKKECRDLLYKGRFMFYYAIEEEVKKYLEDNKTN